MKKVSIYKICYIALFAALICVLSIFNIPTPWGVPFTLQTFIIALCGYVLGRMLGTCSTAVYILLGIVGLPVFTGMKGGIGVVAGPTGGYLIGFLPMAFLCGLGMYLAEKQSKKVMKHVLALVFGLLGLAACHLIGSIWLGKLMGIGFVKGLAVGSIPYLPKDIISLVIAYVLALAVRKALRAANLLKF